MAAEVSVLVLIGVGVAFGLLLRSNHSLRQEVHSLRLQVAALTKMIIDKGANDDGNK